MRYILSIAACLALSVLYSQAYTAYIKVNFLYGSKPKRAFKDTEVKYFGGLHGGHVSIQIGDTDYGFGPTVMPVHIFPKRNKRSVFETRELKGQTRYSSESKTVTFIIPVSPAQLKTLDNIHHAYCKTPPYDYAFFGMRCAAATQDILAAAGLVKKKSRFGTIINTFYPKKLRKRLFRLAAARGYRMIRTEGRASRRWETD